MSRRARLALAVLVSLLVAASPPLWQTPDGGARLQLGRDFGYYASGDMQGTFTLSVSGVDRPGSVAYYIDGQLMAHVTQPPFHYRFSTSAYDPGRHSLQAVVTTTAGEALTTPLETFTFLTADEAQRAAVRILVPLSAGVLVLALLGVAATVLLTARPGAARPGHYGLAGGAICPRCERPFARHVLGLNLVVGKLERCPSCRAWSVVPAASREALRAAEARVASEERRSGLAAEDPGALRRQVEDSRFLDEG